MQCILPSVALLVTPSSAYAGRKQCTIQYYRGITFSSSPPCSFLSLSRSYNDGGSDDESQFMASLKSRLEQVKSQETICPVIVLDCMLPRQVMRVRINKPLIVKLVKRQLANESPVFGMRGAMPQENKKEEVPLTNGVEVEIVQKPVFIEEGVLLVLKAKRRFAILGEVENDMGGWIDAKVKYLDSDIQEEEEMMAKSDDDPMCIDRAVLKAMTLTELIKEWIGLARTHEKRKGQIDLLLDDLGDVPPAEEPSERAFWVGALINPLPEMGVARGRVRPSLIMSKSAEQRVDIAIDEIMISINNMDGSAPL